MMTAIEKVLPIVSLIKKKEKKSAFANVTRQTD